MSEAGAAKDAVRQHKLNMLSISQLNIEKAPASAVHLSEWAAVSVHHAATSKWSRWDHCWRTRHNGQNVRKTPRAAKR